MFQFEGFVAADSDCGVDVGDSVSVEWKVTWLRMMMVENDEGENLINDDDKCDDDNVFMSSPNKGNRNKLSLG